MSNQQAQSFIIMAEKIILTADLYDNAVTERKGDYTAKPRITGTVRNHQIAERILARGSELRLDTIEYILGMSDQEKVTAIAEGKSVVDGVGQYMATITGSFEGEKAAFDPAKNRLTASYVPGKLLRDTLKNVEIDTRTAVTGPVINSIIDSTTGEMNTQLTSAAPAVISGSNIKVAGDDAGIGVFFRKTGGTAQKCSLLIHNNPSELTIMMPALEDGEYTLSIVTQYGSSNKLVKEPRTYLFPVLLYVGSQPSGGGVDRPEIE